MRTYQPGYMRRYRRLHPDRAVAQSRKARLDARRRLWNLKRGPCADCNGKFHPAAMQFDHRDPAEKLFTISDNFKVSLERLLAEIAKCDLVCANCHAVRTWQATQAAAAQMVEPPVVNRAW